jgi:chorismate mutase
MAETHVVSALVDKRAELAGHIARFKQQLGQFRADVTHVGSVAKIGAGHDDPERAAVQAANWNRPAMKLR